MNAPTGNFDPLNLFCGESTGRPDKDDYIRARAQAIEVFERTRNPDARSLIVASFCFARDSPKQIGRPVGEVGGIARSTMEFVAGILHVDLLLRSSLSI